jgi:large subunit ribosomal protein L25
MDTIQLSAQTREKMGGKNESLRQEGLIPGILYGRKIKNQLVKVNEKDFREVFERAGESTLVDLTVDDQEKVEVLIHEIQKNPVTEKYIHIDFYQIRRGEKITAKITLDFIGESPAVKNQDGVLIKSYDELEIKCLPKDLIHDIKVNLSKLENLEDAIRIKDLDIPKEIETLADEENVIATVAPPRTAEELEELEEKVEEKVEGVEVEKGKEREEESTEEGKDKEKEKGSKKERGK